jgi:UDP-glucose 4-epimerase
MGLPVVIVRLFNTVGPRQSGQYGMVVPRFIQQALAGEPLTVYGDGLQSRCFCYITDVVSALIQLMEEPAAESQIFNVGSRTEVTILDLANMVKKITKSSSKIKHIPYEEAYESGFEDMRSRKPNIKKVTRLIGWKPKIELQEILQEISGFVKNNKEKPA